VRRLALFSLFSLAIGLLIAASAQAHLLNMTEVIADIDHDGGISISLELDLLAEFGSAEQYYAAAQSPPDQAPGSEMFLRLAGAIEVVQDESAISLQVTHVQWPSGYDLHDYQNQVSWPKTNVRLSGKLSTDSPIRIRFGSAFIFEEPIALTIRAKETGKRKSRWLVAGQNSPSFEPGNLNVEPTAISFEDAVNQAGIFIVHGFSHIVKGGWDHLLFLLALCLSTTRAWQLVARISLFTLAHTLTLAMASYRLIELNAYWVELAIVGTIVFVSINNLWQARNPNSAASTNLLDGSAAWIFIFGLLHGLGFAASLQALEVVDDYFLINLLGFNLGVELAQICFILVAVGLLAALDRQPARRLARNSLSWLTAVTACLWFSWLAVTS
jgi:hypothetical protein